MREELIRFFWEEAPVIRQRETKNGNKNTKSSCVVWEFRRILTGLFTGLSTAKPGVEND